MAMIDKDALLARRTEQTTEVELPGLGGSVRVRGLSRAEALRVTGKPMSAADAERTLLAMAMVDPVMTEDEVRQWQRHAPAGELQPIQEAILRLSGLEADAVKAGMAAFRE